MLSVHATRLYKLLASVVVGDVAVASSAKFLAAIGVFISYQTAYFFKNIINIIPFLKGRP